MINPIDNGEGGLSVRNKLNNVIDFVNSSTHSLIPISKTGSIITFDQPSMYNELSPISGDLTISDEKFLPGIEVTCYHTSGVEPFYNIPEGKKLWFNQNDYIPDNNSLNVIHLKSTTGGNYEVSVKSYLDYQYGFKEELQLVIDNAKSNSDPIPNKSKLFALDDLIGDLTNLQHDDGSDNYVNLFEVCDFIGVFAKTENKDFVSYNLISGQKEVEDFSGGLNLNVNGFHSQDSNAMTVVEDLNDLTNYSLNDASVYVYTTGNNDVGYFIGTIDGSNNTHRVQIGTNYGTNLFPSLNSLGVSHPSVNSTAEGSFLLDRSNSTEMNLYVNGQLDSIISDTSTGIPTSKLLIGARYLSNQTSNESNGDISIAIIGSSIRSIQNRLHQVILNYMS